MAFTMKVSGVPAGHYRARFARWEESVHEEYGPRVLFEFVVIGGEHDGAQATRFCSAKMSPKSALGKLAGQFLGKKLEPGDEFDPDAYVGREYLVIVQETDSGATRVESLLPATAPDA